MSGWQFWIDRGGTFTDVVARRPDGAIVTHKLLSENPERYGDAALAGIRQLLGVADGAPIPGADIEAARYDDGQSAHGPPHSREDLTDRAKRRHAAPVRADDPRHP